MFYKCLHHIERVYATKEIADRIFSKLDFDEESFFLEELQNKKGYALSHLCLLLNYAFAERNLTKILVILKHLTQMILLVENVKLQPEFFKFHVITICLEVYKMCDDPAIYEFLFCCLCIFTKFDNSISIVLIEKEFVQFSLQYLNYYPNIILPALSNIASVSKASRDSVLTYFTIEDSMKLFRNEENLRELLMNLLLNYSIFEFSEESFESCFKLMRMFYVIIKKEMVENFTNPLFGIHNILLNLKHKINLPFSITNLVSLITSQDKCNYFSISALILADLTRFKYDELIGFNFLGFFEECFVNSESKNSEKNEICASFMLKKFILNEYCENLILSYDIITKYIENSVFCAIWELYKCVAIIFLYADNETLLILFEKGVISLLLEGIQVKQSKLFCQALHKAITVSDSLNIDIKKPEILTVLDSLQNNDSIASLIRLLQNDTES